MRDLRGLRILLTRSEEGCRAWARSIERVHGQPVCLPCLRTESLDTPFTRERLRRLLRVAGWVALSSPRGVDSLRRMVPELPGAVGIAAVGPATAAAAQRRLGRVDITAPGGEATSLAEALLGRLAAPLRSSESAPGVATVVTVAAAGGRRDIEEALRAASVPVERVEVYRTVWEPEGALARESLAGCVDVVLLASPSAVRGLVARAEIGPQTAVITIGPTTSAAAREAGLRVTAESRERSLDGLLEAIP